MWGSFLFKRWGETISDGWIILRISLKTTRLLGFKFSVLIILSIIDCYIWTLFKILKIRKFGILRKIILYYFFHPSLTNWMGLTGRNLAEVGSRWRSKKLETSRTILHNKFCKFSDYIGWFFCEFFFSKLHWKIPPIKPIAKCNISIVTLVTQWF
jgi:hypothetical protein